MFSTQDFTYPELVSTKEQLYRCPMCGAEAYVEDGEIVYTEDEYPYDKIFDA